MHLFSKEHLTASSGIVGASGPTAAGFGLAAQYLRPGAVAVAFFGEGAMNQGMLMESMNLASVWNLPVVFVCKDDRWSITTKSNQTTGGDLNERATGLGLPFMEVDGRDVLAVWEAANQAITRARSGQGATFLHASCVHFEGHFLGFQLIRAIRDPLHEIPDISIPLMKSFLQPGGASLPERLRGLKTVIVTTHSTMTDARREVSSDPLVLVRGTLQSEPMRLLDLEDQIVEEIGDVVESALMEVV